MKISAKSRYALRILVDLAKHGEQEIRTVKEIALTQDISEKFISCLVVKLRKAGWIKSSRGAQGGLQLNVAPRDVTLLKVVEVMDGPVCILECLGNPQCCKNQKKCMVAPYWQRINQELIHSMESITLEEILLA